MSIIEPSADELADACQMDLRLLYSIAISTKRIADCLEAATPHKPDDEHARLAYIVGQLG